MVVDKGEESDSTLLEDVGKHTQGNICGLIQCHSTSLLLQLIDLQSKLPRPRRCLALEAKIQAGIKHAASVVHSPITFDNLPRTQGDWKGQEYCFRLDSHGLRDDGLKRCVVGRLLKYEFSEVPYDGYVTIIDLLFEF